MKSKFKFMCLLLAVLIVPFVTACGADDPAAQETTTAAPENDDYGGGGYEVEEIDPRLLIYDNLPEMDFGGATFTVLYPSWSNYILGLYFVDDILEDPLGGAVYNRQLHVEERFNLNLRTHRIGSLDGINTEIARTVRAGDNAYDLALTHCIAGIFGMVTTGVVADWNTVPHVDFSKPWWNHRMNDELSILGVLLTAVSDFIIFDPNVIYFNKQMITDYGLESPYDLVREYRWTWDALYEMAVAVTRDLDGSGVWDANAQYGFVTMTGWIMDSALHAYGLSITELDGATGERVLNLNNPLFFELIDTLRHVLFSGNQTFIASWDPNWDHAWESQIPMSSGRVLFHADPLSVAVRIRATDVDFGILPFPKREGLNEYLSLSWNGFMVIPQTADLDKVGIVAEALAAQSFRYVIPAYYDSLLTHRLLRDEDSREMLDIIFAGATYDFALNFGNWLALSMPVSGLLSNRTAEPVSHIERNSPVMERHLQRIFDAVETHYLN